jgi:DNA primase
LFVVTPIAWDELDSCANGDFLVDNFSQRLRDVSDRFAQALAAIGEQLIPLAPAGEEFFPLRHYVPC